MADQGDLYERDGIVLDRSKRDKSRVSNPLMKWALLTTTSEDKMQKYGRSKVGSRVVSYHEDQSEDSVPVSFVSKDLQRNGKESEDSEAAIKSTQSTVAHLHFGELVTVKVQRLGMSLSLTLDAMSFNMIGVN
ncbi:hypothetical protein JHK87_006252 [Glycine soja]|nr:hypothetical protein JHK87_006252 [Glycine soja]